MEMWQFNNYIMGYKKKVKAEQVRDISLAWHIAAFNNSKRLKPLKTYIDKLGQDNTVRKNNISREDQIKAIEHFKEIDKKRGG